LFITLILGAINCSIAISDYSSSYAQKTDVVRSKIMPTRMNTPINSSSTKLKTIATNADLIPKIKILSPPNGQKIPLTNNNLVIFNASSYDRSTRCEVSTLLNGVKPYQKTIATGKNGANDYSTWKYKLDPSYTTIREGSNKLTAKVSCLDNPNSFSKRTSISLIGCYYPLKS
jgi:hypothetical protein